MITAAILKKHKAAPRSAIGARAVAKSQSRGKAAARPQIPKFISRDSEGTRVKSLPRDENISANVDFQVQRQSTKNSEVRNLHGQLLAYGKTGNRPSLSNLPTQQKLTVSQVNVTLGT